MDKTNNVISTDTNLVIQSKYINIDASMFIL